MDISELENSFILMGMDIFFSQKVGPIAYENMYCLM